MHHHVRAEPDHGGSQRARRRTRRTGSVRRRAPLNPSSFPGERVIPATSCPAATSSGTSRTPITPLAPATKMRMITHLLRRRGAGRRVRERDLVGVQRVHVLAHVLDLPVADGEYADAAVLVWPAVACSRSAGPLQDDLIALGDHAGDLEADRAWLVVGHRGSEELVDDRVASFPDAGDRQRLPPASTSRRCANRSRIACSSPASAADDVLLSDRLAVDIAVVISHLLVGLWVTGSRGRSAAPRCRGSVARAGPGGRRGLRPVRDDPDLRMQAVARDQASRASRGHAHPGSPNRRGRNGGSLRPSGRRTRRSRARSASGSLGRARSSDHPWPAASAPAAAIYRRPTPRRRRTGRGVVEGLHDIRRAQASRRSARSDDALTAVTDAPAADASSVT